jgi:hypothetical protein
VSDLSKNEITVIVEKKKKEGTIHICRVHEQNPSRLRTNYSQQHVKMANTGISVFNLILSGPAQRITWRCHHCPALRVSSINIRTPQVPTRHDFVESKCIPEDLKMLL